MNSERKKYADIYKGIAILLVILGHSPICNNYLKQMIYAFHMPAFFLIYGLVYSADKHRDRGYISWSFMINKAKRLIAPCYIWGLIYMVFNRSITIKGLAFWLYGNQIGFRNAESLTSLWFLPCMFLAVVGFECLMKVVSKNPDRMYSSAVFIAIACVCALISYLLPNIKYGYPWSIDISFMALAFILFGYALQMILARFPKLKESQYLVAGGVFSTVTLLLTFKFNLNFVELNNVDMASRNYGNILLYVTDALAGSLLLLVVSVGLLQLKHVNLLSYSGENTMQIFIFHKPIVILLSNMLEGTILHNSIGGAVTSLITLLICVLMAIVANKYFPFLFGTKRRNTKRDVHE